MPERILKAIGLRTAHLRRLGSVRWSSLIRRLLTLAADYRHSNGYNRCIINVTYEVTYRCNARCRFCFVDRLRGKFGGNELSTREAIRLVDSTARLKAGLYITGGEPLVRKDIAKIASHAKRLKIKCGINTNGISLTKDKADVFAGCALDYLIVSIMGRRAVHDEIVGVPGALERTVDNLRYLLSLKSSVRVFINFVLSPATVFNLKDVILLAKDLGIHSITCQQMEFLTEHDLEAHGKSWRRVMPSYAVSMAYADPPPDSLSVERMHAELRSALQLAESFGIQCLVKPPLDLGALKMWYEGPFRARTKCFFPWTDTRVAPDGSVYACQFIPVIVGNVREQPLEELLNVKPYRDFRTGLQRAGGIFPACARCCKLYRNPLFRISKG